ncbi:MAG: hypothetical protein EGQ56_05580 [Clostridiales bacterium]|nr:hypothetical protein [Clostridiales bacterium]
MSPPFFVSAGVPPPEIPLYSRKSKKGLQFRYDILPTANIPQEGVDLLIAEHKKHPSNPYILLSRHFAFWVTVWVKPRDGAEMTTL